MISRYLSCVLAASLAFACVSPVLALSQAEAGSIAEKVLALNDPQATAAFQALNAKGVFKVSETAGDAGREIAFRVLELNDAALNAAFNYLKGKGAFELAPVGGLTPADRIAIDAARQAAAQCKATMDTINPLVDEYNASWIPGRIKIRRQISATIEQARAYLDRAQADFKPYLKRTEPEITAVGGVVSSANTEFNSYIRWWNETFANQ